MKTNQQLLIKLISLVLLIGISSHNWAQNTNFTHYLTIGTYTSKENEGQVWVYQFDQNSGKLSPHSEIKGVSNSSYINFNNTTKHSPSYLYAVNENNGVNSGTLTQLLFTADGQLKKIDTQSTQGDAPCYVTVSPNNKYVLTANYTGGSLSLFSTSNKGLKLEDVYQFNDSLNQQFSHIHSVQFDPSGKRMLVTDLKQSKIYVFEIKESKSGAKLQHCPSLTYQSAPLSGPRHFVFNHQANRVYVVNEWNGTVDVLKYKNGKMKHQQSIQIDSTNKPRKGSADIHISPDGHYIYASNRLEHDGIAILAIDKQTQGLSWAGYQKTGIHPRNFVIEPKGNFLLCANKNSNTVEVFRRNIDTGLLSKIDEITLDQPVCLKLYATSKFHK